MKLLGLNDELKDLSGEALLDPDKKPLTLKKCIVLALVNYGPEEKADPEKKFERYQLTVKVFDSIDEVEVSAEELSLIKKCIRLIWSVVVTGRAYDKIESAK